MTAQVQASAIGIVIAVGFTASMAGLMIWMFRVPRAVTAEVAKARRSLDAARLILVPATRAPYSRRGVELACRLAQEQGAEILLLYVIEVPRTLQLDVRLGAAEREAEEALETARQVVALHGLPVRTVVWRAREAGEGIIAAARDYRADLVVMGIGSRKDQAHRWGRTAETLLRRSETEVVFDKLPD